MIRLKSISDYKFRIFKDTQQYVVTFKSPDSYMEVPGW
jgi:hypothetical protein